MIGPYMDRFRESNVQRIRHMLSDKQRMLQSLQWQADLRHWHPDRIKPEGENEAKK